MSVAGPGGTLLAFAVVGFIAFCVMEGVCEMIVLWPIPNAMVEFVRTFVDEDLAVTIGVAYWLVQYWSGKELETDNFSYTYTVTFSALILSAANLADYWNISQGLKSTIFVAAPLSLAVLNLLWVEVRSVKTMLTDTD